MKVSKDSIQKMFLAGLLVCGGIYFYCFELMGPLAKKEKDALDAAKKMEAQVRDARSKISKERALVSSDPYADQAKKIFDIMQAEIPSGQPVAWLPTRWSGFLKSQGIAKQTYRCNNNAANDPKLPRYELSSWTIEISGVTFAAFGRALAGIENRDGLAQITNLQLSAAPRDPENHSAQITFSTFVKSEK